MRQKQSVNDRKIRLKTVNAHITCFLCKGYLIDATTITECLHTFCKSCIVKYLDDHNNCPKCHLVIHQSHPLNYISHDRTMQDIVYKLVPFLHENEKKQEEEFYQKRGLPYPKSTSTTEEKENESSNHHQGSPNSDEKTDQDYHRSDEQVSVCLEVSQDGQLRPLKRRYIRCSVQTTITHLKKFIALKLYRDMSRFKDVEILCNEELLGKDHTLKFITMTRWRNKDIPLQLHYRPRIEL